MNGNNNNMNEQDEKDIIEFRDKIRKVNYSMLEGFVTPEKGAAQLNKIFQKMIDKGGFIQQLMLEFIEEHPQYDLKLKIPEKNNRNDDLK
jgi:hypothetical protein